MRNRVLIRSFGHATPFALLFHFVDGGAKMKRRAGLSTRRAAELSLPFAFASHFAPEFLLTALELCREYFKPSDRLAEPLVMVGVNVIAANTDAEARR